MRRLWILVVPMLLMAISSSALAGGRARIIGLHAPEAVVAGKSFELTFDVRPEAGRREVEPVVKASLDGAEITVAAVRTPRGYAAHLALPKAGNWRIRVDSQYCQTVMTPVTIKAHAQS